MNYQQRTSKVHVSHDKEVHEIDIITRKVVLRLLTL